ncbi:hypothetical protein TTHERM_00301770 (macronuclear) [Tetrahymena thermophila SB210]|uniref:Uncharacterized protein n=1 Tax=Tetrahymena thermophila (strain SB210) TaxID=312017 RepID=I7MIF9_TETTS|nr:hypothetical protein TTHERM_00301770 [Tetrahymena thermophila SB210]EAS04360.2 hypothetical protein TTHERM_00301770 [Tetrahymena thermophila SB210]|eukprot:XP_001024605.2 hypothetical protein TTHERM_00301770 [Tetrahymena thermophila SB210]
MAPKKQEQEPIRLSTRTASKKVDYLQLSNGKLEDFFDDLEEDNKPARNRSRSKKRGRKPLKKADSRSKTPSRVSNARGRSKSLGPRKTYPRKKNLSPDNQLSLLLKWRNDKIPLKSASETDNKCKVVNVKNIFKSDLSKYGANLQALFINALWKVKSRKEKEGLNINDLSNLKIPLSLMKNGILFIWSEKEILGQIVEIMEQKGFTYIENFSIMFLGLNKCLQSINHKDEDSQNSTASTNNTNNEAITSDLTLKDTSKFSDQIQDNHSEDSDQARKQQTPDDITQKKNKLLKKSSVPSIQKLFEEDPVQTPSVNKPIEKSIEQVTQEKKFVMNNLDILKSTDINNLFLRNNYPYFKKTRHTLLMFRRIGDKNQKLELRHQRTSDVVFEVTDEQDPSKVDTMMKEYVYQMIETLLPKAQFIPGVDKHLKMMELQNQLIFLLFKNLKNYQLKQICQH